MTYHGQGGVRPPNFFLALIKFQEILNPTLIKFRIEPLFVVSIITQLFNFVNPF